MRLATATATATAATARRGGVLLIERSRSRTVLLRTTFRYNQTHVSKSREETTAMSAGYVPGDALTNLTICVTGSNRGIGLQLAKELLENDNTVVTTARDVSKARFVGFANEIWEGEGENNRVRRRFGVERKRMGQGIIEGKNIKLT